MTIISTNKKEFSYYFILKIQEKLNELNSLTKITESYLSSLLYIIILNNNHKYITDLWYNHFKYNLRKGIQEVSFSLSLLLINKFKNYTMWDINLNTKYQTIIDKGINSLSSEIYLLEEKELYNLIHNSSYIKWLRKKNLSKREFPLPIEELFLLSKLQDND